MKKTFYFVLLMSLVAGLWVSCSKKTQPPFTLAFYNVENLFDTIDDPKISDERYVPESDLLWGKERYQHKLGNLARVMSSIDSTGFPAVFGLCEVENIGVLQDLLKQDALSAAHYSIIHQDSPDERGIDVALLYQAERVTPIETQFLRISFPSYPDNKTRDVLYTKAVVDAKDTLHIFINHWVSRYGGQQETAALRQYTGHFLKHKTDSILALQADANIILAGDLNDNPSDSSVYVSLGAAEVSLPFQSKHLYNLSYSPYKQGKGSLYYKSWEMFDQVIVSSALLSGDNKLITNTEQSIMKEDWMLFHPEKGEARPNRTATKNYYGGYSDHLPVFIRVRHTP